MCSQERGVKCWTFCLLESSAKFFSLWVKHMTVNFKWKTIAFYIYSSRHAKKGFLKNNYIFSINCRQSQNHKRRNSKILWMCRVGKIYETWSSQWEGKYSYIWNWRIINFVVMEEGYFGLHSHNYKATCSLVSCQKQSLASYYNRERMRRRNSYKIASYVIASTCLRVYCLLVPRVHKRKGRIFL